MTHPALCSASVPTSEDTGVKWENNMSAHIIYLDRSEIREGKLDEVRAALKELVDFVRTQEPQLIGYGFYLNEEGTRLTLVAIHPDSASLEFHMEIAGPIFGRFTELIKLRSIEIYGRASEKVLEQLRHKAELLGDDASVVIHHQHAGFVRFDSANA